jgi:hypothetical protein
MRIETCPMRRIFMTLVVVSACATARSPTQYREDTHSLLYKSSTRLETCYAKALAVNPNANGTIMIHFIVEPRTGNIVKPTVDTERSTAPQELAFCVLEAVDGLTLTPPDSREGRATFVYAFGRLRKPTEGENANMAAGR